MKEVEERSEDGEIKTERGMRALGLAMTDIKGPE